jgi:hypothetical protein
MGGRQRGQVGGGVALPAGPATVAAGSAPALEVAPVGGVGRERHRREGLPGVGGSAGRTAGSDMAGVQQLALFGAKNKAAPAKLR